MPGRREIPGIIVKYASAGGEPAEAFAKGGDSEEHLGGVLFRLHFYNSAQILLCISPNVICYM
jgi:hypothetical protein